MNTNKIAIARVIADTPTTGMLHFDNGQYRRFYLLASGWAWIEKPYSHETEMASARYNRAMARACEAPGDEFLVY